MTCRRTNDKKIAQEEKLERYFFHLSACKSQEDSPLRLEYSQFRLADSPFQLEDRLADNPSLVISSSLYDSDNERRTVILEDMTDFFTYLILYRYQLLYS